MSSASNAGYNGVGTVDDSAELDARVAFARQDAAASKAYHDSARPSLEGGHEVHQHPCLGNPYVQEFATAFLSGASIGTVVAAAGYGAGLRAAEATSVTTATALGCACMHAAGAYLKRRSEQDYLWREFRRETWEWKNYPEGEKKEMVELYESEGFTHEDAVAVIDLVSKHEKKFIDLMMVDELQLMPPTTDQPRAVAPFAAVGFAGTAMGALLFGKCTTAVQESLGQGAGPSSASSSELVEDDEGATALLLAAGLLCAAALAGACEALLRFKGASCNRLLASATFFVLCLGTAAATTRWLSDELKQ